MEMCGVTSAWPGLVFAPNRIQAVEKMTLHVKGGTALSHSKG